MPDLGDRAVRRAFGIPDHAIAYDDPETYRMLRNRIQLFLALPDSALESVSIKPKLDEIGRT